MAITKYLILFSFSVYLAGCAHSVSIAPAISSFDFAAESNKKKIPVVVGYYIPQNLLDREVSTPAGGGDYVKYFPYKDIQDSYRKMLEALFVEVKWVTNLNNQDGKVGLVISPVIKTNSSSANDKYWRADNFTVEIDTLIYGANGNLIKKINSIGAGESTYREEFQANWNSNGVYKAIPGMKASSSAINNTYLSLLNADISQILNNNNFESIGTDIDNRNSQSLKVNNTSGLEKFKVKCLELGFEPKTEGFGKCVLQLSK